MLPDPLPTPSQLFELFHSGAINREELHEAMRVHQQDIIDEMEEDYQNPLAAYIERLRNTRAAQRLAARHSEALIRGIFAALAETPNFPPARFLWNAWHWDVPLSCFIRTKRKPVFRILRLEMKGQQTARIIVTYGQKDSDVETREHFTLERDWRGHFTVETRES